MGADGGSNDSWLSVVAVAHVYHVSCLDPWWLAFGFEIVVAISSCGMYFRSYTIVDSEVSSRMNCLALPIALKNCGVKRGLETLNKNVKIIIMIRPTATAAKDTTTTTTTTHDQH